MGKTPHLIIVDKLGMTVYPVMIKLKASAGDGCPMTVGKVPPVGKTHRKYFVPHFEYGKIDGKIRRRAAVGLNVNIFSAK
jgi:hypothetical protein